MEVKGGSGTDRPLVSSLVGFADTDGHTDDDTNNNEDNDQRIPLPAPSVLCALNSGVNLANSRLDVSVRLLG